MTAVRKGWWTRATLPWVDHTIAVPAMTASAEIPAPTVAVAGTIVVPAMTATAQMPAPTVPVNPNIAVPAMTAHAAMSAPRITNTGEIDVPVMTATAAMAAPSITVAPAVHVPTMTATAQMPAPAITFSPHLETYDTPGTYEYTVPEGPQYIDRIALGNGKAGSNYVFGRSSNGGKAGSWAWDTLTVGVDCHVGDTITIVVAAAAAVGDATAGNPSTITVGANTLTAAGGATGYVSGSNGQAVNSGNANSNKDVSLNGQLYLGGNTTTSSNKATPDPGSGGWGSNSNGIAGRVGGIGQAWLYFH